MARAGSTRVPNKSIRKFSDSSLLEIKVCQLQEIDKLNAIYVNSESPEILDIARSAGASVIKRDPNFSTNEISINKVYKHLAETTPCENILFAHLTSPLVKVSTLSECYERYVNLPKGYDSLATVTELHKFLWFADKPINYDPDDMPRSQDLPSYYMLNFAYNILPRNLMIERENIVGRAFFPYFLDDVESVDVDTELEFHMAEFLYDRIYGQ